MLELAPGDPIVKAYLKDLQHAVKKRGWTLVAELSTHSGGRRVVPAEIQKKLKAGYPTRYTIFEDTQVAVLYQDREFALSEPVKVAGLLNRFLSHDESHEREFERAMQEFKSRIPDPAQSLGEHIAEAHRKNRKFREAFAAFVALCRETCSRTGSSPRAT